MMWQPLLPSQRTRDDERIIATGGEDCAILLWNARQPESKATCFLTMDSPIVKLAFTPDGSFIAGATSSQVLIWKVGNTAVPRASWSRPPHSGWLSPKEGLDSEVEDEHCLCWDATGQKLAYGTNNRVSSVASGAPLISTWLTGGACLSLLSSTLPDRLDLVIFSAQKRPPDGWVGGGVPDQATLTLTLTRTTGKGSEKLR